MLRPSSSDGGSPAGATPAGGTPAGLKGNTMIWQPEVDELQRRRELAQKLGGAERVARQHERGKLTIRERIDAIVDPGSFDEIGGLAGRGAYEQGELVDFTPLAHVGGLATVDGRRVVVEGSDFTVSGGAADISSQERPQAAFFADVAREYRVPLINFIEERGCQRRRGGE